MTAPAATPSSWPTRLGGYDVVRPLSLGGMGAVLLAERRSAGFSKRVAIKVILPRLLDDPTALSLFADEARLAARFVHPNLVPVHDFGEEAGVFFMVMDLVEGISVLELVRRRRGPLPIELAAQIVADAGRGLAWAHALRDDDGRPLHVVHRDVSPDNLIVAAVGAVKVLDFGIARSRMRQHRTAATGLLGKPPYMAPERLRGLVVDERADAWSLGVILHELLTGKRLFTGSGMALLDSVDHGAITSLPPSIPTALRSLVDAALTRDVARRSTTAALVDGLDRFLREHDSLRTPTELRAAVEAIDPQAFSSSSAASSLPAPALAIVRGRAADVATGAIDDAVDIDVPLQQAVVTAPVTSSTTTPTPTRSRAVPIAAASTVALLALVVTGVVVSTSPSTPAAPPLPPVVVTAPPAPAPLAPPPPTVVAATPPPPTPTEPDEVVHTPPRRRAKAPSPSPPPSSDAPTGIWVPDRTPYVDVWVDDVKVGVSPLGSARRPFTLAPGRHRIALIEPSSGQTIAKKSIVLVAGTPVVVRP